MANVPKGKKSQPAPEKKGIMGKLRPVELITIGIFVFALLIWGMSKCGGNNAPVDAATTGDSTTTAANNANPATGTAATTPPPSIGTLRPLYVILDSLKLRKGPHLDSAVIRPLLFGLEVYDMGKRTNFEQTFKVSPTEKRTAPWIQVRTAEGQVGWVFGAGLEFYRKSRVGGNPTIDLNTPTATTPTATTVTAPTTTTATPPNTTVTTPNTTTATQGGTSRTGTTRPRNN